MKSNKDEFNEIIHEIIEHPEFQRRKTFKHHGEESVYDHSLQVSYLAYRMAKKLHLDAKSAAIGGLLHDFYTTPWMSAEKAKRFRDMHGFVHAKQAYQNALKVFPQYMTPKIKDIITKHMFPLNINPPRYRESWIVTLADKLASGKVFLKPKDLPMYIGIKKRKK
ncbi:MAG: HD domain-containing protein [Bacilli bacterium]|nr:HD domain-containing protein [Bacilli bacterium]